jgi:CRP-like cAMP-binding protein
MSITRECQDRLKSKPLFSEFSQNELENFLDILDLVQVKKGDVIVKQGDPGDCMFILIDGLARVTHHCGDQFVHLAEIPVGEFFGEIALVDAGVRSASVVAEEDSSLLRITQATILAAAGVYPNSAFKFLLAIGRTLVGRLRQSNQRYLDTRCVITPPKI